LKLTKKLQATFHKSETKANVTHTTAYFEALQCNNKTTSKDILYCSLKKR